MTDLPTDPVPYAEFILRHLMQEVMPGEPARAVAETEHAVDGDRWFWADDNAKVLEFLALPQLWQRYPDDCARILRFIEGLCQGPFILRRTGHARLDLTASNGEGLARFIHTFMHVSCDLPQGIVTIGMRFHDIRTARNLILTGNYVHFVHQGRSHLLDVEDAITEWAIEREGPQLVFRHASDLHFLAAGGHMRLGTVTYRYTIDARSMFVDAEAVLDLDPDVEVQHVVLTIGQDQLSHGENGVHYGTVHVQAPSGDYSLSAGQPGHSSIPCSGATYWSLAQRGEMRGFALAVHSLPSGDGQLASIEARVQEDGRYHWAAAQYVFPGPHRGGSLRAAERKTITSGGFYDRVADNAALFAHAAAQPFTQPLDMSISYDYGAELNAFARCHRSLSRPELRDIAPELRAVSRELFDRYHAVYAETLMVAHRSDPSAIFSRPLCFLIYGLIDMWHATGEEQYRESLRDAVAILLDFERNFIGEDNHTESAFLMGQSSCVSPFVDCHSAALLALLRALPVLEIPSHITSIDRGLDAYRLETMAIDLGDPRKYDMLCVGWLPEGAPKHQPHAYWNFCVGITLRLFKLLRQSGHQATREILDRHRYRIGILEAVMRQQLIASLRDRDGALEVKTGVLSGEGNSETQPWVALGLVEDSGDL